MTESWDKEIAIIEKDLVEVRTDPKKFAERCLDRVKLFNDKIYSSDKDQASCRTKEGAVACENASNELKGLAPLSKLTRHKALDQYANEICKQLCQSGELTFNLSNHSEIKAKLSGLGATSGTLVCCISINSLNVNEVVLNMVIDDGLPNRKNRKDILAQDTKFVGIGYRAKHPKGQHFTVLLLVESVTLAPQSQLTESAFHKEQQHQREIQNLAAHELVGQVKNNVEVYIKAHEAKSKEGKIYSAYNQQAEEYNLYGPPNYPFVGKQ